MIATGTPALLVAATVSLATGHRVFLYSFQSHFTMIFRLIVIVISFHLATDPPLRVK